MKLEEIIKGITVSEIIGNTTKRDFRNQYRLTSIEPEHVFVAVKRYADRRTCLYHKKQIEKRCRCSGVRDSSRNIE